MQYISKAALWAPAVVLCGCATLFEAGFENDLPGRAPGTDPSAWTNGDVLISGQSRNVFVTSKDGIVGRQALAFVDTAAGVSNGPYESSMRSAPIADLARPVTLKWHGKFGNGGGLQVAAGLSGQTYLRIECDDGDIHLNGDVIATYLPGDNHQIEITLSPSDQSYRISLEGMASNGPIVHRGMAEQGEAMPTPRAFASFRLVPSGKEQLVYILDDVEISQRPSGWSDGMKIRNGFWRGHRA